MASNGKACQFRILNRIESRIVPASACTSLKILPLHQLRLAAVTSALTCDTSSAGSPIATPACGNNLTTACFSLDPDVLSTTHTTQNHIHSHALDPVCAVLRQHRPFYWITSRPTTFQSHNNISDHISRWGNVNSLGQMETLLPLTPAVPYTQAGSTAENGGEWDPITLSF